MASDESGLVSTTRYFNSDLMEEFRSLDGALGAVVPGKRSSDEEFAMLGDDPPSGSLNRFLARETR